jgi:hypothetical protein
MEGKRRQLRARAYAFARIGARVRLRATVAHVF